MNIWGRIGYARQGGGCPPVWADGVFRQDHTFNVNVKSGENDNWGSVSSFDASLVVPTTNENRPYIVRAA